MLTAEGYDFVVIGAGVFGAWTAYFLRQSGASVCLVDAYGAANNRASSSGETRIIRMGYGPDELYTRWSARSLPFWQSLSKQTGVELFRKTGVLWLSNDADRHVQDMLTVLHRCGVSAGGLSASEIAIRYPQLSFHDITGGVLEPESGILMARRAVQLLVREMIKEGVEYSTTAVVPPQRRSKLNRIETSDGGFISGGTYIFACGPWLPKVFPGLLDEHIHPTRQEVFFIGIPAGHREFGIGQMPVWLHHSHPERPYVLPDIENRGLKIAFDRHGPDIDPDTAMRVVSQESIALVQHYLSEHVPALRNAPIVETRVCQYENTSNGDFLIDRHPELENVWVVGGGSGHGFKHGPAVGEYVSSSILHSASPEPRFLLATKPSVRVRSVF